MGGGTGPGWEAWRCKAPQAEQRCGAAGSHLCPGRPLPPLTAAPPPPPAARPHLDHWASSAASLRASSGGGCIGRGRRGHRVSGSVPAQPTHRAAPPKSTCQSQLRFRPAYSQDVSPPDGHRGGRGGARNLGLRPAHSVGKARPGAPAGGRVRPSRAGASSLPVAEVRDGAGTSPAGGRKDGALEGLSRRDPGRTHCWQGSLRAHTQMEVWWGGPHLAGLPTHQLTARGSLTCARTARLKGNQFLKWIFEGGLQPCDPGPAWEPWAAQRLRGVGVGAECSECGHVPGPTLSPVDPQSQGST